MSPDSPLAAPVAVAETAERRADELMLESVCRSIHDSYASGNDHSDETARTYEMEEEWVRHLFAYRWALAAPAPAQPMGGPQWEEYDSWYVRRYGAAQPSPSEAPGVKEAEWLVRAAQPAGEAAEIVLGLRSAFYAVTKESDKHAVWRAIAWIEAHQSPPMTATLDVSEETGARPAPAPGDSDGR